VACTGDIRNAYKILVRKPQGKRPLWVPRHSIFIKLKFILREILWEVLD